MKPAQKNLIDTQYWNASFQYCKIPKKVPEYPHYFQVAVNG